MTHHMMEQASNMALVSPGLPIAAVEQHPYHMGPPSTQYAHMPPIWDGHQPELEDEDAMFMDNGQQPMLGMPQNQPYGYRRQNGNAPFYDQQ